MFVKASTIVATATVVFVRAVIFAVPPLNLTILPTSVASQPTPPLTPVTADRVKVLPEAAAVC